eukprot:TRINITY_DN2161_c0_g1_i2.p1 TRINITY_DN2161_c0_g1~~TRINITY_DN2161_c0_g1_i2.p1  ORF type:complete len:190 (+),score=69.92 TRINITY_DN2161_c0_g1_i2:68-637(+)
MGSMGHVVAGVLGLVNFVFLCCVLGDGRSLVVASHGVAGIGAYHDYRGFGWSDNKAWLKGLGCTEHKDRGLAIEAFTFIALFFTAFAVLLNLLGAQSGKGTYGMISLGLNAANAVFLLIAFSLVASLYDESFGCDLVDISVSTWYDLNYGLPFMVLGFVFSLANVGALAAMGALSDAAAADVLVETPAA